MAGTAQIPVLTPDGKVVMAIIDEADAGELCHFHWRLNPNGYPVRYECIRRRRKAVLMHRQILGINDLSRKLEADHINRNPLDNRRSNLRIVTHAQNMQNRKPHARSSSRYRGVHWNAETHNWRARCRLNGRYYHLGYFNSEDEAGAAAARWRTSNMAYATD